MLFLLVAAGDAASVDTALTVDLFQFPRNRNFTRSGDDTTTENLDNRSAPGNPAEFPRSPGSIQLPVSRK
jgi:hypothetical protein